MRRRIVSLLLIIAAIAVAAKPVLAEPSFGVSLYGAPKYTTATSHPDWTNPEAPKGGTIRLAGLGTYDTFNPFIVKGIPPRAVITYHSVIGYLFQPLMTGSLDEPSAEYGLVAETEDIAPDRASVVFQIRKEATFNDGSPITPEDVIWSFQMLTRPGMPQYHDYFADVTKAEKVGDRSVRFTFKDGNNRELPIIMGQLPVLSKAWWTKHDIDKTTLDAPLGNGPYEVDSIDAGRTVSFKRVKNWWGDKLNLTKGLYNFDTIRIDYFRDDTVSLEAFKAGNYDVRQEQSSKNWAIGYEGPALDAKRFTKELMPTSSPEPMQGYVFNLRRDMFADIRVRQAFGYLFDFEWANKTLFYNAYTRSKSYWNNSELGSSGLPTGAELELLNKYKGKIPDTVFTTEYKPPVTDGSGTIREGFREALKLFKAAGWTLKDNKLVNDKTGKPFELEILLDSPAFERITLPYVQNLERAGITAHIRTVDASQYVARVQNFDYDMIMGIWGQSASPGNEQRDDWSSKAADTPGSSNYIGLKDPVVDELVEQLITVKDYEQLKLVTHALDRILLNGYYLVPAWYTKGERVAYWAKIKHPATTPKYASDVLDSWWIDPAAADQPAAAPK